MRCTTIDGSINLGNQTLHNMETNLAMRSGDKTCEYTEQPFPFVRLVALPRWQLRCAASLLLPEIDFRDPLLAHASNEGEGL